jgi:Arc/MetJ-type ribon-helix-helix transcriptional regulator
VDAARFAGESVHRKARCDTNVKTETGQDQNSLDGSNVLIHDPGMAVPNRIRPLCTFTLDPDLIAGLKKLRERDGVSESETVRRALRKWLERKGVVRKGRATVPGRQKGAKRAKAGRQ